MRTLFTVIFAAVFLAPGLFIIYGAVFSIILLFVAISSGDYLRFTGVVFSVVGGFLGFVAAAQLLGRFLDNNIKISQPLWLKCFLVAGLLALIFTLANSPETFDAPIMILLLMPIPVVLYLIHQNRQYLWKSS